MEGMGKELIAPVLFLTYRRFDTAQRVFESIRQAKPSKLYFASNAPKPNNAIDHEKVQMVRGLLKMVDWPCEVKIRLLDEHLPVKESLNSSITWFFEAEEYGIILEDDCLPHPDFYVFCSKLLNFYKDDFRIWSIGGNNFQNGLVRGDGSYYLSAYNHVWGWGSWRRAWMQNDFSMKFWKKWRSSRAWHDFWDSKIAKWYWTMMINRTLSGSINTWDYCWTANMWHKGGLAISPNVNLVSNIGFGGDATHTTEYASPFSNMKVSPAGEIKHPTLMNRDIEADAYTFNYHYSGMDYQLTRLIYIIPLKYLKYLCKKFTKFLN